MGAPDGIAITQINVNVVLRCVERLRQNTHSETDDACRQSVIPL